MQKASTTSKSASDRLLQVVRDYERVLVVMHDNPDPDAIATGWAILVLMEEQLRKPVRLVGGGAIVRAENKYMVELLSPPFELVARIDDRDDTAIILVDCSVGSSNHLAAGSPCPIVGMIDHHVNGNVDAQLSFQDLRADAAATASIAASYLQEQGIDPGMKLATAILYALRTEASVGETNHSELDREMVKWLTDWADPTLLAEIENAPLEPDYYGDLVLAMERAFVYDDTAICILPRASGTEIVGEVADLLIRCRGICRILCAAIVGDDLLLSARSEPGAGNAAKFLEATLNGQGGCGGHAHRAGGKIADAHRVQKPVEELFDQLRVRWLKACNVDRQRGTPLVARREIVEHL